MSITKEQFEELCVGYIQRVYNETQTEGWAEQRSALFAEVGVKEEQYEDEDDEDDEENLGTFQDIMMTTYGGDLDKTLQHFFCQTAWWCLSRRQWFTCYCIQQYPKLNEMSDLAWKLNKKFKKWLWSGDREQGVDKIKSILGLDDCLK